MPSIPGTDLPSRDAEALASALREAREQRRPRSRLTDHRPTLTVEGAYRIQQAGVAHLVSRGARLVGYKLGFTSPAKQTAMGIHEPIYGTLLASMRMEAGRPLARGAWIHPKVEPEVAFVLGSPLAGSHVTAEDVLAATATLHPALDVLDSRFQGYRFALPDVIADNASGAAFVVGPGVAPLRYDALGEVQVTFRRNGQPVSHGVGRDVMGNPAEAVAWLVRDLAARRRGLSAGDIVLSGSLVAPLDAAPGDTFEAHIEPLGSVALDIQN